MIGKQSSGSKDKGPWMLRPLQAKQTLWKEIDKEKQLQSETDHFNISFISVRTAKSLEVQPSVLTNIIQKCILWRVYQN